MTAYFDALTRHDLDAIAAAWAPDGHCHVAGQADATGPDGVRAYWAELFGALPDMRIADRRADRRGRAGRGQVVGDRHLRGPGQLPGHRADLRAPRPRGPRPLPAARRPDPARGRLHRRHHVRAPDRPAAAARLDRRAAHDEGLQRPGQGAPARALRGPGARRRGRLARARRLPAEDDERLPDRGPRRRCDDVRRRHQGDVDRRSPRPRPRSAASTASCSATPTPTTAARRRPCRCPTLCHPAERIDAEGDGGRHYFDFSQVSAAGALDAAAAAADVGRRPGRDRRHRRRGRRRLRLPRRAHPRPRARDDRAVPRVRPRRADQRTASTRSTSARAATARRGSRSAGFNLDTEQARASIRKVAALEPSVAWPGHADAVTGDVRAQLERAASETS